MTEQVNAQEISMPEVQPVAKREPFHVLIRFKAPQEGVITVYAEDQFQARRIVVEQFKAREDFAIVDCFPESSIKDIEEEDFEIVEDGLAPEERAEEEAAAVTEIARSEANGQ